eukprot:365838-Chlamydomonas_euryale.AAC.6
MRAAAELWAFQRRAMVCMHRPCRQLAAPACERVRQQSEGGGGSCVKRCACAAFAAGRSKPYPPHTYAALAHHQPDPQTYPAPYLRRPSPPPT